MGFFGDGVGDTFAINKLNKNLEAMATTNQGIEDSLDLIRDEIETMNNLLAKLIIVITEKGE